MKAFESYVAQDMEDITMENVSTRTVKSRSVFLDEVRADYEREKERLKGGEATISETIKGVFHSDKEGEYIVKRMSTYVDTKTKMSSVSGSVLWFAKYAGAWQLKRICYLGRVDENFEEIPFIDPRFTGNLKAPPAKPVLNSKTNAPPSK